MTDKPKTDKGTADGTAKKKEKFDVEELDDQLEDVAGGQMSCSSCDSCSGCGGGGCAGCGAEDQTP